MTKVQHISGITKRLPFEDLDFYDLFRITFENSELGGMKRLLPLSEMAVKFGFVFACHERKRGSKPLSVFLRHLHQPIASIDELQADRRHSL